MRTKLEYVPCYDAFMHRLRSFRFPVLVNALINFNMLFLFYSPIWGVDKATRWGVHQAFMHHKLRKSSSTPL